VTECWRDGEGEILQRSLRPVYFWTMPFSDAFFSLLLSPQNHRIMLHLFTARVVLRTGPKRKVIVECGGIQAATHRPAGSPSVEEDTQLIGQW
jgi:hypothetical protein